MKDIRALNHNLQDMTKKELSNMCEAHHYSLKDEELKIVLHLMKNNPSSILNEEYQIIFLIELKKQTSEKTSKEFKDILNHGFIQELELLH